MHDFRKLSDLDVAALATAAPLLLPPIAAAPQLSASTPGAGLQDTRRFLPAPVNKETQMIVSYDGGRGLTASLFEVADNPISGYASAVNPVQGAHDILTGHFRYDLAKYLPFAARYGVVLVAHADNLTNQTVWLPGWGFNSIDTVPVRQGRVVYAGFEFSAGKK